MTRSALALALSVGASACIAAPPTCTEIGTQGGLELEVDTGGTFGQYRVEIIAGGDILSLDYEVSSVGVTCKDLCSSSGIRFAFDQGFEAVDVKPNIFGLVTKLPDRQDGPDALTVRVYQNGTSIAERAITPAYTESEINGPGCGVTSSAEAIVQLPVP
jgi:hypothetical protein